MSAIHEFVEQHSNLMLTGYSKYINPSWLNEKIPGGFNYQACAITCRDCKDPIVYYNGQGSTYSRIAVLPATDKRLGVVIIHLWYSGIEEKLEILYCNESNNYEPRKLVDSEFVSPEDIKSLFGLAKERTPPLETK